MQPSQVYRFLRGLNNGKASGIDKISNRILKQSKDIITPALTEMFNIFIQFNIFPDDLKPARVSPIFKDGDAEELGQLQTNLYCFSDCENSRETYLYSVN